MTTQQPDALRLAAMLTADEWNQCEDNHWRVTETPRAWMPLPPTSAEGVEHG